MSERGAITFGPIVGVIVIVLAFIGLLAICNENEEVDTDGLGRVELVSHEYGECDPYYEDCGGDRYGYGSDYGSEDRNRNRGRNRGAFSPGPFDDSPIDMRNACISLDCSGRERQEDRPPDEEPMP